MSEMKVTSIFAKNKAGEVRFLTVGYEVDVPDSGSLLRHVTYDAEFFEMSSLKTVGFDPADILLAKGWTQTTKAVYDAALEKQADVAAKLKAKNDAESAAYVAREQEKKQAVVDALLSLGKDSPELARLAQLYA